MPNDREAEELAAEIDDFEAKPAVYQIGLVGYDENKATAYFRQLGEGYADPEEAIDGAKLFIDSAMKSGFDSLGLPEDVMYLSVEVEEMADIDGYLEGVGTIFQDGFKLR